MRVGPWWRARAVAAAISASSRGRQDWSSSQRATSEAGASMKQSSQTVRGSVGVSSVVSSVVSSENWRTGGPKVRQGMGRAA